MKMTLRVSFITNSALVTTVISLMLCKYFSYLLFFPTFVEFDDSEEEEDVPAIAAENGECCFQLCWSLVKSTSVKFIIVTYVVVMF